MSRLGQQVGRGPGLRFKGANWGTSGAELIGSYSH